ncbi:MAG: helix-turn-helix transcriptional regulator [Alphaproteobacteria bacterium]|nr:helix-turn-helix transcriptional regulator [Alphaproteobacteria bacterium]
MKLADWIRAQNLTLSEVGRACGVDNHSNFRRYVTGKTIPRPETMARIVEVTGGAVQPNDFYDLPNNVGAIAKVENDQGTHADT